MLPMYDSTQVWTGIPKLVMHVSVVDCLKASAVEDSDTIHYLNASLQVQE